MNKILKKMVLAVLFVLAGSGAFAAGKKSIVCTTFPQYDWVMNILGKNASNFNVTLLQNNGTDLHSYQPSFKDIAKISTCDLFVYVGGESDKWVSKAIENATNKDMKVVNLLETLGDKVKEEEIVEGMQAEEEEDEDEEEHHHHEGEDHHHHHDEDEDEIEYDEHVWLSVKNAIELTNALSSVIQTIDPANAEKYIENTTSYVNQLSELDNEYQKAVDASNVKTILFGDRFPFRYLVDDYNLDYYAAFVGCSAETEASFKTIIFLANKVDELGLGAVLTIEKSDKKIARTIIENTKNKNQKILEMDSLQSITQKDIKKGRSYLSAMKNNLEVLKQLFIL